MNITHTQLLLQNFNTFIVEQTDFIKEKELKILYALSDLLEEKILNEENFINNSLDYLKVNYGLNKSVWKVLLKLYDEIPNFLDKLSNKVYTEFINTNHMFVEEEYELGYDINNYGYGHNQRQYCIKKLFYLIRLLTKNFSIEDSCQYIGVFVKELDNKKCAFSMNNLSETPQQFRDLGRTVSTYNCNKFAYLFFTMNSVYRTLKALNYRYIELIETCDTYKKVVKENRQSFIDGLKRTLDEINIIYIDPLEKFKSIITSYKNYTNEKFLNYKGLLEIKNKVIKKEDEENIGYLMKEFNKSEQQNQVLEKVYIELLKYMLLYKNDIVKSLDKREILYDYVSMSKHFKEKMFSENDFSINNLLKWSNEWHLTGETRGKKEKFINYDINRKIDNYIFEQILDSHKLHEEGQAQNHCVYSYTSGCVEGKTIIVSMKDIKYNRVATLRFQRENTFKKILTLKFFKSKSNWVFAENKKRFNKICNKEEQKIAEKYFLSIKEILKHK